MTTLSESQAARDAEERRELVQRLVAHRIALGLSQSDLAARMGVVQGTVSDFEHGDDPRISSVYRYARALGMEPRIDLQP